MVVGGHHISKDKNLINSSFKRPLPYRVVPAAVSGQSGPEPINLLIDLRVLLDYLVNCVLKSTFHYIEVVLYIFWMDTNYMCYRFRVFFSFHPFKKSIENQWKSEMIYIE